MMLLQVSETMSAANSHNGHLANMDEVDDKPMLIVKKTGDGPGITALINRQLQGTLTVILYDKSRYSATLFKQCLEHSIRLQKQLSELSASQAVKTS